MGTWNAFTPHFLHHFFSFLSLSNYTEIYEQKIRNQFYVTMRNEYKKLAFCSVSRAHISSFYQLIHRKNISAYASNNSSSSCCRRCQIVNIIQIANRYVGRLLIRLETRDCIVCFNSIDCIEADLIQTP